MPPIELYFTSQGFGDSHMQLRMVRGTTSGNGMDLFHRLIEGGWIYTTAGRCGIPWETHENHYDNLYDNIPKYQQPSFPKYSQYGQ